MAESPLPVTVIGVAAPGTIVDDGVICVIAGPELSTVNASALDVPPPGAGFDTVNESDVAAARLAAGITAEREVALAYVVASGVAPTEIVLAGTKRLPVIVTVVSDEPTSANDGATDVAEGAGLFTFSKSAGLDVPPPGAGLVTKSERDAVAAKFAAGITAVRVVPLTYVVESAVEPRSTVDAGTKPLPLMVTVVSGAPTRSEDGVTVEATGTGSFTLNVSGGDDDAARRAPGWRR